MGRSFLRTKVPYTTILTYRSVFIYYCLNLLCSVHCLTLVTLHHLVMPLLAYSTFLNLTICILQYITLRQIPISAQLALLHLPQSGGSTPAGRAKANALTEIHPPWLPSWQSKVVVMKFYNILTAVADATNDLSIPFHEQRTVATTASSPFIITKFLIFSNNLISALLLYF